jgi:Flp pilus assembly pilin Flp
MWWPGGNGRILERGIEVDARMPRTRPKRKWRELLSKRGQGLVEYALILVTVAIVIIVILTYIGQVVFSNMYSKISSGMATGG